MVKLCFMFFKIKQREIKSPLLLFHSLHSLFYFTAGRSQQRNLETMDKSKSNIQRDWEQREFIEAVTTNIKKVTEFLNRFGMFLPK